MRPTMYSGLSRRKRTVSTNISSGPTTQFCTSDSARTRPFRKTRRQLLVPDGRRWCSAFLTYRDGIHITSASAGVAYARELLQTALER
jgi:hypothetical protein